MPLWVDWSFRRRMASVQRAAAIEKGCEIWQAFPDKTGNDDLALRLSSHPMVAGLPLPSYHRHVQRPPASCPLPSACPFHAIADRLRMAFLAIISAFILSWWLAAPCNQEIYVIFACEADGM